LAFFIFKHLYYTEEDPANYGAPTGFTQLSSNPFTNINNLTEVDTIYDTNDDGLIPKNESVLITPCRLQSFITVYKIK
jgi:hypothetical protein